MVRDVPGDDVGQRTNGERVVAGDASFRPRLVRKVLEKRDGRQPDAPEFLNEVRPRSIVGMRRHYSQILVKTGQGVLISARKPKCAIEKDTFAVVHVIQDLTNRPLSRFVRVPAFVLRNAVEKLKSFIHLTLNRGHDFVTGYKVNVLEIVGSSLSCLWSCHWVEIVAKIGQFRNQPRVKGVYLIFREWGRI